jgi:hypothetical protein
MAVATGPGVAAVNESVYIMIIYPPANYNSTLSGTGL